MGEVLKYLTGVWGPPTNSKRKEFAAELEQAMEAPPRPASCCTEGSEGEGPVYWQLLKVLGIYQLKPKQVYKLHKASALV